MCLGPGGVARAVRADGFEAVEWDRKFGDACDLSRQHVRAIKKMISQGQVIAACLAPPHVLVFRLREIGSSWFETKLALWACPVFPNTSKHK
eukprot:2954915-Pyramimonas_sp.AAC.1